MLAQKNSRNRGLQDLGGSGVRPEHMGMCTRVRGEARARRHGGGEVEERGAEGGEGAVCGHRATVCGRGDGRAGLTGGGSAGGGIGGGREGWHGQQRGEAPKSSWHVLYKGLGPDPFRFRVSISISTGLTHTGAPGKNK